MQLKRRIIMVGATFFLAAATGHLMQNGPNLTSGAPDAPAAPQKLAAAVVEIAPQRIVPLAGSSTAPVMPLSVIPSPSAPKIYRVAPSKPQSVPLAAAPAPLNCTPVLSLSLAPAAMVDLALAAPCNLNARVVIRHSGLTITAVTDAKGGLTAAIPALSSAAHFTLALPDGAKAEADLAVPALADYDRVAVQWQGNDAFQLHAFEFGADYGDAGHVSAESPRGPGFALQATGGFLTALGEPAVLLPMLAQVYTFPSAHSQRQGAVRLSIEAEVTPATCGRDMLGETLEAHAGLPVKVVDLTLAMPGCDATGDYVVLNNLLPDVTIARN